MKLKRILSVGGVRERTTLYHQVINMYEPIRYIPQAFKKPFPKHVLQYRDYQLPITRPLVYFSEDYINKGTHASINLDQCTRLVFTTWQVKRGTWAPPSRIRF